MTIEISHSTKDITGSVTLNGSKSISNRVLIIRALSENTFHIENLSTSDDTQTLLSLLENNDEILDCHHAGTTFRFLTAFLSMTPGTQILTGSERMKNRPVKDLVEALRPLGANIDYLEKEGYPPLKIHNPREKINNRVKISASTSSQFISALLLIGPTLPEGLTMDIEGPIVSRPYVDMTIGIMRYFGVEVEETSQMIRIAPQKYEAKDYVVEGDWSAASYYYIIASLSKEARIRINGLFKESLQGDKEIEDLGKKFGVKTEYHQGGVTLIKDESLKTTSYLEHDFLKTPDLAQSVAVICAGLGVHGLFSGLQTLRVKETDRIAALQTELKRLGVQFIKIPPKFAKKSDKEFYLLEGKASDYDGTIPAFDTYDDHRMAMSLAPLSLLYPVRIHHPEVVSKSYPDFWNDLSSLGFDVIYL
jgi:3-phosphoshikimate 1-carboxyvinyltransferase